MLTDCMCCSNISPRNMQRWHQATTLKGPYTKSMCAFFKPSIWLLNIQIITFFNNVCRQDPKLCSWPRNPNGNVFSDVFICFLKTCVWDTLIYKNSYFIMANNNIRGVLTDVSDKTKALKVLSWRGREFKLGVEFLVCFGTCMWFTGVWILEGVLRSKKPKSSASVFKIN